MLYELNLFFQIITITIGTFLIERYVLLEPAMEPKKQRIFYIIAFCTVIVMFFTIGAAAMYVALIFGGLNISLGRKKHRLRGFFMTIPLIGILNGSGGSLAMLPHLIVNRDSEDTISQLAVLVVYLAIFALLVLFYLKGKNWREWFWKNMKDRRPGVDEYILIVVSGTLMLVFSNVEGFVQPEEGEIFSAHVVQSIRVLLITYAVISLVLTIAIIVMVMQGNRRKFYYDKVKGMQFSVIATMADIVENRDENTGGHIKRTARYVEIIGRKLREEKAFPEMLTERYLSDMIVAAPLHDIGKIHIPDAILNKPGRLTEEEFEIMKTHTTAGRKVLMQAKSQLGEFDYINIAIEMVEYHHEWWNGKGYPNGICGEEIPLCARIMAVADVFDALTAKRCYKEPMPVEKAYGIIEAESGTHFDPTVAAAFLFSKQEVEAALKELSLEE